MKNEEDSKEESFRDSISTVKDGKRVWIYPQKPKGSLYDKRKWVSYICLALLFGLPFVKIDGEPFLMLNILERKFVLFGQVFWPQDFFLFGLAMLTFMVFIVLFTVVFGRVWCGWTCPQTIFLEMVFRRIEYWIDGDAAQQKALARMPWNREKILKRGAKHSLFFIISFLISNAFLAYIIGIDSLKLIVTEPLSLHMKGFVAILIFTGVFYFIFSWFREQVCLVACPYGRLQGVFLDKDSVVVAYDYVRGEQRAKFKKNETRTHGDCIDCHQCVNVCPTGIDIRNGTQLECVNCTACIDVCDHMMEGVGLEKGLIRYASEKGIKEKVKLQLTGRMLAYSVVLLLLMSGLSYALLTRSEVETTVLRTPGILYQKLPDNKISNLYNFKIVNKSNRALPLKFKLLSESGMIKMVGEHGLEAKKGGISQGVFFIVLDKNNIKKAKTKIEIGVYSEGKLIETVGTNFMGPIGK